MTTDPWNLDVVNLVSSRHLCTLWLHGSVGLAQYILFSVCPKLTRKI
eukprot:SAG31_NODE_4822_length_2929_cov_2.447350_2_plen_47_part_00